MTGEVGPRIAPPVVRPLDRGDDESVRDRRLRIKRTRTLQPAVFVTGWPADTDQCPRCRGWLEREPAYLHCRYGCGRLWPIRGASVEAQRRHEQRSGLSLETDATDGRRTVKYAARVLNS